ncbi:MAG: cyclodeaminase, partial [Pseudomonadota bacterium]
GPSCDCWGTSPSPAPGGGMPKIMIVTEAELRRLVPLDAAAISCIREAFKLLAGGDVIMPPVLGFEVPARNAEVDVKTAYVPGLPHFAIKISPGFFDNPQRGLPSLNGLMTVFSAETGLVEAVLLDNGFLTDVRTAAAGAVAADALARDDARRVAILGAGEQAGLQLEALQLVRDVSHAALWARDVEKAEAKATQLSERLGIDVVATSDAATACEGADIIITTTPATTPLISADMLKPGQHVTAMGSDAHHKRELASDVVHRATRYVPDRLSQVRERGELRAAIADGTVAADACFAELGNVLTGDAPGRLSAEDITVADLTGTGIQDTAIATLATARARAEHAGTWITS